MPTYEYRCKRCGEHLEVVQSFTDDALTDCPACGAAGELRKVFGSIGITFKGSGFYKTDSRAATSTKTKTSESEGSSSTEKPDSKPASTTESTSSGSGSSSSTTTSSAA